MPRTSTRTKAGAKVLALWTDSDVRWPDEYTRVSAGAMAPHLRAIEDEMLDKVAAAVRELDEYGEWCTDGHRGHWVGAVTKKPILAAIERIRSES